MASSNFGTNSSASYVDWTTCLCVKTFIFWWSLHPGNGWSDYFTIERDVMNRNYTCAGSFPACPGVDIASSHSVWKPCYLYSRIFLSQTVSMYFLILFPWARSFSENQILENEIYNTVIYTFGCDRQSCMMVLVKTRERGTKHTAPKLKQRWYSKQRENITHRFFSIFTSHLAGTTIMLLYRELFYVLIFLHRCHFIPN